MAHLKSRPFSRPETSFRDKLFLPTGRETELGSGDGRWANATVYILAPAGLETSPGFIRVYVTTEGGVRARVRNLDVTTIPWVALGDGTISYAFQVNGWPGNLWEVTYLSTFLVAGLSIGPARCTVEFWGSEASCCGDDGDDAGAVVEGDATVDVAHAPPTNAINGRSHAYAYGLSYTPGTNVPVAGTELHALCASEDPLNYYYSFITGLEGLPRTLQTSSLVQGVYTPTAADDVVQCRTIFAAAITPDIGPLYTATEGFACGMCTESTMVATTGTQLRRVRCDDDGRQRTLLGLPLPADTYDSPTLYQSLAVVDVDVAVAAAAHLMSLQASVVAGAGTIYLQLFDRATVPVSTVTVPEMSLVMSGASLLALSRSDFAGTGLRFANGVAWALSSTPGVYTSVGGAEPPILGLVHMELSE